MTSPRQLRVGELDTLHAPGLASSTQPPYVGPLQRHIHQGDLRLGDLLMDDSPAAYRLWNFLLSEKQRLTEHRLRGRRLVGAMKDLGTAAVMAWSVAELVAFYPDGAWWTPCVMKMSSGDLEVADRLGVDEAFCPVRAMLGAFVREAHFPRPDLLVCSAGATCDDFSAIAQRLNSLGFPILWWEIPHRRSVDAGEEAVALPGGSAAPRTLVDFVRGQLAMVRNALSQLAGRTITDDDLRGGIHAANRIRRLLDELRELGYRADPAPMGALEMLIAEMLAIHFCSDRVECEAVLSELLGEVQRRVNSGVGVAPAGAVRVFWVNPVADLRAMNLLEKCGGRLCGTDFLFAHALDELDQTLEPLEALARAAVADPMVGPGSQRAGRIARDIERFGAQAVVISRVPGASHAHLSRT